MRTTGGSAFLEAGTALQKPHSSRMEDQLRSKQAENMRPQ